MMRMVVVMMVMKLVEVVGNLKKGRKMNQTSNYEANSRQRYMCSLGYPKKTLMLNFAMVKKSRHRFRDEGIDRRGSNWPKGTKMCNFDCIYPSQRQNLLPTLEIIIHNFQKIQNFGKNSKI